MWAIRVIFLAFIVATPAAAQSPLVIDNYPRYATDLNPSQRDKLRLFAREVTVDLAAQKDVKIVVGGHADFDAQGAGFEKKVSVDRANVTATALRELIADEGVKAGLSAARMDGVVIEANGYGTAQAIHRSPTSEAQRVQNRRVEISKTTTDVSPPADNVTAELAASPKYQLYQQYLRDVADGRIGASPGESETLTDYAEKCERATGITLKSFSCSTGFKVPGQEIINGKCNYPNVLNKACDPGSRFQVLPGSNANAVAVAHCRKMNDPGDEIYGDIAIIQYNQQNGAICFYQALGQLPGDEIPSPAAKGSDALWKDKHRHWLSPSATNGAGCPACHDNGALVRTPYLAQLKTPPHVLPEGFKNSDPAPLRYVGSAFSSLQSWSITLDSEAPDDNGAACTTCHRLGVSNHPWVVKPVRGNDGKLIEVGTAMTFGVVATAEQQASKNKHSNESPIWMRPDAITFQPAARDTAMMYRACAAAFINSGFKTMPHGCNKTVLGEPWKGP